MGKKLSEMTLEELWNLFPIFLTEHQESWKQWYEEEKELLLTLLPESVIINLLGGKKICALKLINWMLNCF